MDDTRDIAVRAEASAEDAHHRLNRMNGSIDRLGSKVEAISTKVAMAVGVALFLSPIVTALTVYYLTKGSAR